MRLTLVKSEHTVHVSPHDILDYKTFDERHQLLTGQNELKQFERFHAARQLISEEMDTFLDAKLAPEDKRNSFTVDVCGIKNGVLRAVFCETSGIGEQLSSSIEKITNSQNVNAVILLPRQVSQHEIQGSLHDAIEQGKATMEVLGWFGDSFQETFRETLSLIELLGNETRMRMLAPLLEKRTAKKDYRSKINPKLVYHNLSSLSDAGLLDENEEGAYDLSQFGKTLLAEFITFLEKTRRTLVNQNREVKND